MYDSKKVFVLLMAVVVFSGFGYSATGYGLSNTFTIDNREISTGYGLSNIFSINNINSITVTATNNWDGTATVTWPDNGTVRIIRQEQGNSSNTKQWTRQGTRFEDKYELTELKRQYIYIVQTLDGAELGRTTQAVMPDIVVVLVRGYDPGACSDGVDTDYWTLNEIKDDDIEEFNRLVSLGMVESVKSWFENTNRNITCWDASGVLNGRKNVQWNVDRLKTYISGQITGDYKDAKVHLIGHSMGGLISRQYAYNNPIVNKIFTVQTPHTGSSLADVFGYFAGDARDNLKPSFLEGFNNDYPVKLPLYMFYSNNYIRLQDSAKYKSANFVMAGTVNAKYDFKVNGEKSDGAVPLISGYGSIYKRISFGNPNYGTYYEMWQRQYPVIPTGSMDNNFDHGTGYRHENTLNKIMEWLGYPQISAAIAEAITLQDLPPQEAEPLYYIAGFEGEFSSALAVSKTVNIGSTTKAYFRAIVSFNDGCAFTLTRPDSTVITSQTVDGDVVYSSEGGVMSFEIANPAAGQWVMTLTTTSVDPVQYGLSAFETQQVNFAVSSIPSWVNTGQSVLIRGELSDNAGAVTGASVTACITLPDALPYYVTLYDDGTNGDNTADDGIYHYVFNDTAQQGRYEIEAKATAPSGSAFERTAFGSFTAATADISIAGLITDTGIDSDENGYFNTLRFIVPIAVQTAKQYRLTASLMDSNSEQITLINTGEIYLGMDDGSITLDVAAADFAKHNVDGPYLLANIQISDVQTGLVMAAAADYTTTAYAVSDFEPLDSDGDGLSDWDEINIYGTDPFKADTDEDGVSDGDEVLIYGTNPLETDTDGDGMPDGYEISYGLNPLIDDTAGDLDGDGLTNIYEFENNLRPDKIDTDDDGRNDKWEIENATNPLVYDNFVLVAGDINRDGVFDIGDLSAMAHQWLSKRDNLTGDIAPDGGDGIVDMLDLAVFAEIWEDAGV